MCDRKEREYDGALFLWGSHDSGPHVEVATIFAAPIVSRWIFYKELGQLPKAIKRYRLQGYGLPAPDKYYLSFYLSYKKSFINSILSKVKLPY